jgi:transcriptional/translational regulatory protein YebC/TACO1
VTYLPLSPLPVSDPAVVTALDQLVEALEEHDDVKEVFTNAAFPAETS